MSRQRLSISKRWVFLWSSSQKSKICFCATTHGFCKLTMPDAICADALFPSGLFYEHLRIHFDAIFSGLTNFVIVFFCGGGALRNSCLIPLKSCGTEVSSRGKERIAFCAYSSHSTFNLSERSLKTQKTFQQLSLPSFPFSTSQGQISARCFFFAHIEFFVKTDTTRLHQRV